MKLALNSINTAYTPTSTKIKFGDYKRPAVLGQWDPRFPPIVCPSYEPATLGWKSLTSRNLPVLSPFAPAHPFSPILVKPTELTTALVALFPKAYKNLRDIDAVFKKIQTGQFVYTEAVQSPIEWSLRHMNWSYEQPLHQLNWQLHAHNPTEAGIIAWDESSHGNIITPLGFFFFLALQKLIFTDVYNQMMNEA